MVSNSDPTLPRFAAAVLLAGGSSRSMLASARLCCILCHGVVVCGACRDKLRCVNFHSCAERRVRSASATSMHVYNIIIIIGPILWGHSGPLSPVVVVVVVDHMLWTSILHCHSPGVATVARRLRYS